MAFGLLSTGFAPKTFADVKAELEAKLRAAFGESIDLDPQGPFGQLVGIVGELVAEGWEVAEAVNAAFDPDKAEGAALDALCALTGTIREPATRSTVTITAIGTAGTVLASGRRASVLVTGTKFETTAGATLASVSAWSAWNWYNVGDRRTSDGKVWQATVAGWANGVGPNGAGPTFTDGGVTWRLLGTGDAAADVAAQAVETGPKVAVAFSLATIETPVSGWSSVTNLLDAELGRNVETDPELRLRREDELRGIAASPVEAIRARILKVAGVVACSVFQNTTMSTDGNGLPAKSVEALVQGGTDADVRRAVFESVAAGIETYGGNSGTLVDSQGITQTVKFSRPSTYSIYVDLYVEKDPLTYPADGDAQIKAAIVAFGALFKTGRDVISQAMKAQAFKVAGVLNVTAAYISTSPSPWSESTISMGLRDLALFDTSRINVYASDATP